MCQETHPIKEGIQLKPNDGDISSQHFWKIFQSRLPQTAYDMEKGQVKNVKQLSTSHVILTKNEREIKECIIYIRKTTIETILFHHLIWKIPSLSYKQKPEKELLTICYSLIKPLAQAKSVTKIWKQFCIYCIVTRGNYKG